MKREERSTDSVLGFMSAFQGMQALMWTALPALVTSFNAEEQTVEVQPQISVRFFDETGTAKWLGLPVLVNVPVVFPSAGGYSLTFPIKPGDECLVIFSSRNIDAWWDQGPAETREATARPVNDIRMHDLSDGFAILGPRSRPNAISNISAGGVELRNDAGSAVIAIRDNQNIEVETEADVQVTALGTVSVNAGGQVTIEAASNITVDSPIAVTITAPDITLAGNVLVNGSLATTGNINGGGTVTDSTGKSLGTHVHTQNNVNQPNTGPPA